MRERDDEFSGSVRISTAKTAETHADNQNHSGSVQNPTAKTAKTLSEAKRLGLVATWSIEFGYVSVHDPTSGEWHDPPTKEAPSWATGEARKRKELYKSGNRKALRLSSREMSELWEAEHASKELEGIFEEHPIEEE
ncbi:MAG: hypothetical protein JOZ19_15995 [Rubrobacter sp.]|nr:hypothetical protein [Rubrobacter sp.]